MLRFFHRPAIAAVVAWALATLAPGHVEASPWWVDEFDGPTLDSEWMIQLDNMTDAGWQRNFNNSQLETTGLVHNGGAGKWINVRLTRQFDPVGDFSGRFVHSWQSNDVSERSNVFLWLMSQGSTIVEIALADADVTNWGLLRVIANSELTQVNATQTGTVEWEFHRSGELLEVFLNGALFHTVHLSPDVQIDQVTLIIQGNKDWQWAASHAIDHLSIVPEPASIMLAGAGVMMLVHRRRSA